MGGGGADGLGGRFEGLVEEMLGEWEIRSVGRAGLVFLFLNSQESSGEAFGNLLAMEALVSELSVGLP